MTGLLVLTAVLLLSTALGVASRTRSGRLRQRTAPDPGLSQLLRELGHEPGERATLLQFSSAFCAPCRATRATLASVAQLVPGTRHVEVDAEQHLDVVRRLGIVKTPTTLVLDGSGRETARATGAPRQAEVLAALAGALP